ncbi:hypothetical protein SAMN05660841_00091 [Sphingobacterium nematocida]|uniref:Lipocalin-like domain-containing protein n=1 Tax=Sphingobacterium nematocida TaxID=1513896 RepID=A0A1T5AQH6_9SPHI|nr:hypothetical protein [Sphingobacterium nematocida]SKB37252.1 hypothetical protein SAMN05660841_00091 [Sphingobacterium nematocida]
MKTTFKILSLLFVTVTLFTFAACSKDDDPADNDLFIGKYEGTVSFSSTNDSDTDVARTNGSVTVTKIGDKYSFNFSNGIPTIGNIIMEKGDNNTIIFNDNAIGTITVTASDLDIIYAKDGKAWTADCKR